MKPRSLIRRIFIALTALIIPGAIAVVTLLVVRSRSLPPVNYPAQYTQLVTPATTTGENAWDPFIAATLLWGKATAFNSPHHGADFTVFNTPDARPAITPRAAACLQWLDDEGLPALLDRIVSAQHIVPPTPTSVPMLTEQLPELSHARALARVELARMALAHTDGRDADALHSFERAIALARPASCRRMLVSNLTAISIHALATSTLIESLRDRSPPPDVCLAYAELIDRYPLPSIPQMIEVERIVCLDALQHAYTAKASTVDTIARRTGGLLLATHARAHARAQQHFDEFAAIVSLPEDQRLAAAKALDSATDQLGRRYLLLTTVLPSSESPFRYAQHADLRRDAARTMLALARYHHDHARYPAALTDLVPTCLPALPVDPFNRPHPLAYRLLTPADADPHNRPYLLYSLAFDGLDNNAREPAPREYRRERQPDGTVHSILVSALNTAGYDLVLNTVRTATPPEEPEPEPPTAADDSADPPPSY